MRINRVVAAFAILVLLVGASLGLISGAVQALGRDALYAGGWLVDGGASTIPPGTFDSPAPQPTALQPAGQPSSVLEPAEPGQVPDTKKLAARLNAVDKGGMGGTFSGSVTDIGTGKAVYANNADTAYIPASTMKLLTSVTALELLGPQHRFETSVVGGSEGQVILVGGGDPYLADKADQAAPERASVAELAKMTAKALQRAKETTVTVGYDGSLFTGPDWNPLWLSSYTDQVTPVSALWVDEGRISGGAPGPREQNPEQDAGEAFAKALRRQGVKVTSVSAAKAKATAKPLATAQSMPLGLIIEQVLLTSDNDGAEVLLRQSAIAAGKVGSFEEGRKTIRSVLTKLGAWDKGTVVHDGSGLSRATKVPAGTIVKLLRLAAEQDHPKLRAILTGLPVAGVSGSLRTRFSESGTDDGRGYVRAKTGTLRQVHALAGYVRTEDGSTLAYAFLVNDAKNDYAAKLWLERVTSALASCGCR